MSDTAPKPRRRRKKTAPEAAQDLPSWGMIARRAGRLALRGFGVAVMVFLVLLILGTFINPRLTPYMLAERFRQGGVARTWVSMDQIAPEMARSVVAAEDANFCNHWGFDVRAIRMAIDTGAGHGASTISQQVTKNVFLWQGHSWVRKALEAMMTPGVELVWSKRRILEVYLNVAETDPGLFGVEAAAQHYFKVPASRLTPDQAARIAAVLPDPKGRNPTRPTGFMRERAAQIRSGADTIEVDGRAACFEH